jgi:hypothetical protein
VVDRSTLAAETAALLAEQADLSARRGAVAVERSLLDLLDANRPTGLPPVEADVVRQLVAEAQLRPGVRVTRAVANVLSTDVALGNEPSGAPSPFAAARAPLLDRLGRPGTPAGVLVHPVWPSGLVAGQVPGDPPEKQPLPSGALVIADADAGVAVFGIAVDVSLTAAGFLDTAGRSGLVGDWLRYQARQAADAYLATELETAAASGAGLGAALDLLNGQPFSPAVVAGPASTLLAEHPTELAALGLDLVADANLTSALVIDPAAVDLVVSSIELLAVYDVPRVGLTMSSSVRLSLSVDPAGVAKVTTI